jgi:hypothetical protein
LFLPDGFDEYVRKLKTFESGDAARLVTQVHRHGELTRCAEDTAEYKGEAIENG